MTRSTRSTGRGPRSARPRTRKAPGKRAKSGRTRSLSFSEITKRRLAHGRESIRQALQRADRWMAELIAAGYQEALEEEYSSFFSLQPADTEPRAVLQTASPASEDLIRAIERELECPLPPSYRAFLRDMGGLRFMSYWTNETTPAGSLVERSRELMLELAPVVKRRAELSARAEKNAWQRWPVKRNTGRRLTEKQLASLRALLVGALRDGEAQVMLLNLRDARDESPVFRPDPAQPGRFYKLGNHFAEWLSNAVDAMMADAVQTVEAR
ncbi:MAG: SMI1/KNR4 family protein [Deltaproteobacteria bacterium]|nr:SMI1/KNR4 family protein [Deltaproteobacteria bacterium]